MNKVERDMVRMAKRLGVEVLSSNNINGHHKLRFKTPDGRTRFVTFGSSPSSREAALSCAEQSIRRILASTEKAP